MEQKKKKFTNNVISPEQYKKIKTDRKNQKKKKK